MAWGQDTQRTTTTSTSSSATTRWKGLAKQQKYITTGVYSLACKSDVEPAPHALAARIPTLRRGAGFLWVLVADLPFPRRSAPPLCWTETPFSMTLQAGGTEHVPSARGFSHTPEGQLGCPQPDGPTGAGSTMLLLPEWGQQPLFQGKDLPWSRTSKLKHPRSPGGLMHAAVGLQVPISLASVNGKARRGRRDGRREQFTFGIPAVHPAWPPLKGTLGISLETGETKGIRVEFTGAGQRSS